MNSRDRVLNHLAGKPVDRLPLMPITMQFAADVIGRKYYDYVHDHRVLVEAQLRTVEKYDFDYVSCISDPAREAFDCGATVEFFDDQPPAFKEDFALLADKATLLTLTMPKPEEGRRMSDRLAAARMFKEKVGNDKLIEGWIEGPMAEGSDLRGINAIMLDFFDDPPFLNDLFDWVTEMEIQFARAQIEAGCDLIGIGDAAASLIGPDYYNEYIQPREKKMIEAIHAMGAKARLHICGNTSTIVEGMGATGADIVDLDYFSEMAPARAAMGPDQVLLGNIEPVGVLRNLKPDGVLPVVRQCHRDAGSRYIVGAGCEVPRDVTEANMRVLCDYAKSHRPEDVG